MGNDPFSASRWLQQVMLKLAKMAAKISDETLVKHEQKG
jgi:hypothetical protein